MEEQIADAHTVQKGFFLLVPALQRGGSQGNRQEGQQLTLRKTEHFIRPTQNQLPENHCVSQVKIMSNFYRKLNDIWEFF